MEHPILFSSPMIRALLAGTKTQMRRILKPQPKRVREHMETIGRGISPVRIPDGWEWKSLYGADDGGHFAAALRFHSPYGLIGDRLWVRETHAKFSVGEGLDRPVPECIAYRATCDADGSFDYVNGRGEIMGLKVTKWTPAIFMPRWASRIDLAITKVRAERLHDITEDDARAEGCTGYPGAVDATPREEFEELWKDINGLDSWKANPWVWVIEFKRVELDPKRSRTSSPVVEQLA